MIHLFAHKYRKLFTYPLFVAFYIQVVISPLHAAINSRGVYNYAINTGKGFYVAKRSTTDKTVFSKPANKSAVSETGHVARKLTDSELDNGGPVAPEATSFKAVGSDNLVNLFTGDFSYSIPLIDVGGYPINLFYSGGITMEQEASWAGLGWNINPGTVNRSVRGIPDDFNGEDKLIQSQNVKPNRTWGGEVGIDGELLGVKQPKVNLSLGMSFNNYLGPALEVGAGISVTIPITENIKTEKAADGSVSSDTTVGLSATVGVGGKLNSRSGLTLAPSLNASLALNDKKGNIGAGISTSYNSRTGIKELNFSMSSSKSYSYSYGKDKSATSDWGNSLGGASIDFARPTYMPTLRMPMEYSNYSGQLEFGAGMFGMRVAAHAQGYYSESKIPDEWKVVHKPLVGFIYSQKANSNKDAVMDFTRLNDGEVTPRTPVLSAPQYAYDVFSIQGEGTGGSIRAYRGDIGFMKDNETRSKDKNISIGVDIAPAGHWGGNWNIVSTPTRVGGWEDGNNTLKSTLAFQEPADNSLFENVYFRNPGEATVSTPELLSRIGEDNLVRFKLSGSDANPRLESVLEQFNKKTLSVKSELSLAGSAILNKRDKRTQVTTMLTGLEASEIGLEKTIRNYSGGFNADTTLNFSTIGRTEGVRKSHHISEINVLEQSGMRYVYGLPVYNVKQKEYTFSVRNNGNLTTGLVNYSEDEATPNSPHNNVRSNLDGYFMSQETPAYASSFLLTGLISPDYVDVTGNGITEDDLGNAVKFNYQRSADLHKYRTPRNNATDKTAHFNEGLRSERKDNKATISYGEREVWYVNSIESKSMIAIFTTEWRDDAKGVKGEMNGERNALENANKRLSKIDLYNKAEIKAKGITNARPVKTVHFEYNYSLCRGTPDNSSDSGKLTLKSIYFSYNGQNKSNKDRYVFNYGHPDSLNINPRHAYMASDRWGTYKDPAVNPSGLTNADFPYATGTQIQNDKFAAAWSLRKILLPSGGQMEVEYEADDYAYVQNKRASDMLMIHGFGNSKAATVDNALYVNGFNSTENMFVYIKVPHAIEGSTTASQSKEILEKYLEGVNQLAFKLLVNMPDGPEPLTVYSYFDEWGLCEGVAEKNIIYIKMRPVEGKSPLAKSAIGFLTESMPKQAFPGYNIESDGIEAFLEMVGAMLGNLKNAFKNVENQMRSAGNARTVVLNKSFVRLNNAVRKKYGGGIRVKRILVRDNWNRMTNQFTSAYGQDYQYTTKEKINGVEKVISSGVASYEPGLGSEENPFREIIAFSNKMPLASAQYGAIEMPMLDALYPAPGVGYSKVTVRSIHRKGTHQDSVLRSAIGKQVTEFYTAKDYPTFSSYTPIKTKEYHFNSFFNLLYKQMTDRKTVSQGFLVETNDMHGKMKMQAAFSESDENTPLSYSYHTYKNTGKNGLNDKVDFVYGFQQGQVIAGNIGIDMELMTDVREFKVLSDGFNGQIQTDFFSFVPWPIFGIFMLPIQTFTENRYRAVSCTKLINYHAIEDSVIVMDKGSVISTKTIAYDAETGAPIVTKTRNEFKDPIYNVSYPAYWAYPGMSPAYHNIERQFKNVNFRDGRIQGTVINQNISFESGDEIYITKDGTNLSDCLVSSGTPLKLWALDTSKNSTSLTVANKYLVFLDSAGNPFTRAGVDFKIVRSGKRNLLGNAVASITCMSSPIVAGVLAVNSNSKAVAVSAMEFKEKWQTDAGNISRHRMDYNAANCSYKEVDDCNGYLEKKINPYLKGLLGNIRTHKNIVFYGERQDVLTTATAIRKNGYLTNFVPYWNFSGANNLVPNATENRWVWNEEVTSFNTRGAALETKNALGIFNSTQHGFAKTMQVAAAANSRVNEMGYDGFEDAGYNESLNLPRKADCVNTRHFDLSTIPGTTVISAESAGFHAHSGKKVLSLPANTNNFSLNYSKDFPVKEAIGNNFDVRFQLDTTKTLTTPGVKIYETFHEPLMGPNATVEEMAYNYGGFTIQTNQQRDYFGPPHVRLNFKTKHFFRIVTEGIYKVSILAMQQSSLPGQEYEWTINGKIFDSSGSQIELLHNNTLSTYDNPYSNKNVCLKPGLYSYESQVDTWIHINSNNHENDYYELVYQFKIFNPNGTNISDYGYKSTDTEDGCIYSIPLAGKDAMLNKIVALEPGKKMFFSGWVKETCTPLNGIACAATNYSGSAAVLKFEDEAGAQIDNLLNLNSSGPIIEGWQKVEGTFIVPLNCRKVRLGLKNSTASPSYWDDIRIHPFNANMKSYAYDPNTLRLTAELDENNYASFYEYDEEGQLIRVKKETAQGIKTIKETRAAKQQNISTIQE